MKFQTINRAYNSVFKPGKLSFGVVTPIENYEFTPIPSMSDHIKRAQLVEQLGFRALWVRDVPFHVPNFMDAGQTYDPFTYLGFLTAHTNDIALGISSVPLPLHHPAHVFKSSTTIDQLSEGRMLLGVATGDRYEEYEAMNFEQPHRAHMFREAFQYIRAAENKRPRVNGNYYGTLSGNMDILPKPDNKKLPMLITGFSQQSMEWNAEHGDGWISYPRDAEYQKDFIDKWRGLIRSEYSKPFMQPYYVDLVLDDDDYKPLPIHLGMRTGANHFIEHFKKLEKVGVNHVGINLRYNKANIEETLICFAEKILPHFSKSNKYENYINNRKHGWLRKIKRYKNG